MYIAIDRTGTLEGFRDTIAEVAARDDVATLLVLAGDENDHRPDTTDPILQAVGKPLYGGVFPQVLAGREHFARGTVVLGITETVRATVVRDVSKDGQDLDALVRDAMDPERTDSLLIVLVDGFARRLAALVRALFDEHGLAINYLGGGAGSLSMQQKPCLFTNAGMLEDAALLLQLAWPSGVGVAHGWQVISQPMKVTRANHTTIEELNYEPAFTVYQRVVAERAGVAITPESFFQDAMAFPFGIRKIDTEVVVRDPLLLTEQGGLVCVGEVPEGSFVHILQGIPSRLVDAARDASALAADDLGHRRPQLRLVVDCISRALFQGDRFGDELAALDDGLPMVGALTLGEIANSGRDFLELYNKTVVVGLFAAP
jgi:hypothetical protein